MLNHKTTLAACAALTLLAGCASNGDPRDPLEPMNRAIHSFNETVDKAAIKPIAQGYKAVMPGFGRTGVRNFFSNLDDVSVVANDLLQLKIELAARDFMRLSINTTFGLAGVLDIASEAGLRKHNEDFGQTLGHWGMGTGPYLVLPILGPSDFRDTAGLIVDSAYLDPVYDLEDDEARGGVQFLRLISRRAELLEAKEALDTAAVDGYEYTRDFYLERRRALVYDGKPPKLEE
ncbi:MAG: VacJ family lipoprotein [Hydrogenophilaceae bacterium]|nr:VacJ family lipoprotein [Hydrogenophilaceae bacterium]